MVKTLSGIGHNRSGQDAFRSMRPQIRSPTLPEASSVVLNVIRRIKNVILNAVTFLWTKILSNVTKRRYVRERAQERPFQHHGNIGFDFFAVQSRKRDWQQLLLIFC